MIDTKKRQPKGIPTGGEFASNEHDEAKVPLFESFLREVGNVEHTDLPDLDGDMEPVSTHQPDGEWVRGAGFVRRPDQKVDIPAALIGEARGEVFQDRICDDKFYAVSANVLGIPSTYYFDGDSRIIGRAEYGEESVDDRFYIGDGIKGGELAKSAWKISDHAAYGAIRRLTGGEKRPGFVGANAGMMHAQEELRAGLFSDRAADSALIIGVMEGHLSRGVPGKDAYAELKAWGLAAQSNPEFYDGMEDTITELYGGIPREDIPKKRPKIAALVRWEDSVSSTGTISASRRRGRMVAAAVLSGQSKWWNLRDSARTIIDD